MATYLSNEARRVIRMLREAFPDVPVIVLTVKDEVLEREHDGAAGGDCKCMGDHWRIRLSRTNTETEMIDSIEHEFAHGLDEFENGPATEPHRASFWLCLKRCHKVVRG